MISNLVRTIRRHQRLFIFILLLFVALAFGLPGAVSNLFQRKEQKAIRGKIFDREITEPEFLDVKWRWRRWANFYIRRTGHLPADFPFDMPEHEEIVFWQEDRFVKVISSNEENYTPPDDEYYDNLARTILVLRTLAERADIKVTPNEIRAQIEPIFRTQQGAFDVMQYRMAIKSFGMSETAFERTMGELILITKYANLVFEPTAPTLEKIYQAYLRNNEEIKIKCVAFTPDDFMDKVKIKSPEEMEHYFRDNIDDYRIPEKIQIEYILADYDSFEKTVPEPALEELKDYYEANKASFKASTDESAAADKPFDQVKEEVKSQWLGKKAHDLATDNIMRAEEKIRRLRLRDKAVDLEAMAREFSLRYGTPGFFSQNRIAEIAKEIGSSEGFTFQVFTYSEKDISDHLSTDKGFIIFRVLKKKPARTLGFTMDVKAKVSKVLKEKKAQELAKKQAEELSQNIADRIAEELKPIDAARHRDLIPEGATMQRTRPGEADSEKEKLTQEIRKKCFKNVITEPGLEPVATLYFTRQDTISELPETDFQFTEDVFELTEGEVKVGAFKVIEHQEIYYLTQVTAHRLPTGDDFETQKARLESQVTRAEVQEFRENWRKEIKSLADKLKPKAAE